MSRGESQFQRSGGSPGAGGVATGDEAPTVADDAPDAPTEERSS